MLDELNSVRPIPSPTNLPPPDNFADSVLYSIGYYKTSQLCGFFVRTLGRIMQHSSHLVALIRDLQKRFHQKFLSVCDQRSQKMRKINANINSLRGSGAGGGLADLNISGAGQLGSGADGMGGFFASGDLSAPLFVVDTSRMMQEVLGLFQTEEEEDDADAADGRLRGGDSNTDDQNKANDKESMKKQISEELSLAERKRTKKATRFAPLLSATYDPLVNHCRQLAAQMDPADRAVFLVNCMSVLVRTVSRDLKEKNMNCL
jgi:hypothetical protein